MRERNVPPPRTLDDSIKGLPTVAEILLTSERWDRQDPDKLVILEGAIRETAACATQAGRETDSCHLTEVADQLAKHIAKVRAKHRASTNRRAKAQDRN
jgi:hypothetical protein